MDISPVITTTPTIGDGTVVHWYLSEAAASEGRCVLSASRNRITVGPVDIITLEHWAWLIKALSEADDAFVLLRKGASVEHMATHKRVGMFGPLEPVK